MTLEELIRQFRTLSKDRVRPYLTAQDDVVDWLNEAQDQACVRKRLILEIALPLVAQIEMVPGTSVYPLHPSVVEIVNIRMVSPGGFRTRPLDLKTTEWMDKNYWDWRNTDYMRWPTDFVIQDDTSLRVPGTFEAGDVIHIDCYRTPLVPMAEDDDTPEIHNQHHRKLVQWALYRAFSVPDTDLFDPQAAAKAEAEFTEYFGLQPDADLRRSTRIDVPHHTYQSIV